MSGILLQYTLCELVKFLKDLADTLVIFRNTDPIEVFPHETISSTKNGADFA